MSVLSDRIPYQAIIDRPKLTLPDGERIAVWVILNGDQLLHATKVHLSALHAKQASDPAIAVAIIHPRQFDHGLSIHLH